MAILNSNPETVSTDYDRSDRLYFEEITLERVRDLYEFDHFRGVVTCVGSQLAQNLTPLLAACGIPVLGTDSESIDTAEDRARVRAGSSRSSKIPQPAWQAFTTVEDAGAFADEVGYPVLVRPSYVLSGQAMRVIHGHQDLARFLAEAARLSPEHPVVITKFVEGADEVELDAISDGQRRPRRRDPRARRAGRDPLRRRDLLPAAPPHVGGRPGVARRGRRADGPGAATSRDRSTSSSWSRTAPTRSSSSTCGRAARSRS